LKHKVARTGHGRRGIGALGATLRCAVCLAAIVFFAPIASRTDTPVVREIPVDGMIHPVSAEFVVAGIEQAVRENAALVLIPINTPGGLDTSMRQIIEKIINSPVPVAVYVGPSGSRAASAGFLILLSADVAAMAPGTNSGAAHPVFMGGQPDEVMKEKVTNDAAAYLRSIAGKRGRNVQMAEKGITESKSFTESEALGGNLINVIAADRADLLRKLDGMEVTRFDGRKQVLHLEGARVESSQPNFRQTFLSRILDPNIAFILLIVGVLGLYVEFTHPGIIIAGVAGGISLILSLFALSLLPINWAGAMLIALAVVFFVLEAKFVTHGVLAVGGLLSMILGALMLINTHLPGGSIRLGTALSVAVPFGGITIFLLRLVIRARALKVATGEAGLIGQIGEVQKTTPSGTVKVHLHGDLWNAVATQPLQPGDKVKVNSVDGLTLHVEPASNHDSGLATPEPTQESRKGA
jgi:membrane-bound serine protease (ClpP class)